MGVFDDKKFETLDWMSQITETIDSELNGLLARLPDRLELDLKLITSLMSGSHSLSLSAGSVVRHFLNTMPEKSSTSWEEDRLLHRCFALETDGDVEIDFENGTMNGTITFVKVKQTFEDSELQQFLGANGTQYIQKCNREGANVGRMNEVMELLGGCEAELKGRSIRRKTHMIRNRVVQIMKNNEWRIRDAGLANKVGYWITDYVLNGNLAAFSNFCKLKVMTHQNMPIYSIEEQQ